MIYQTRSVEAFPNGCGFAVTSIEGRCGVKYIDFKHLKDKYNEDFSFRCHRSKDSAINVYPVHQASLNAVHNKLILIIINIKIVIKSKGIIFFNKNYF